MPPKVLYLNVVADQVDRGDDEFTPYDLVVNWDHVVALKNIGDNTRFLLSTGLVVDARGDLVSHWTQISGREA